MKNESIFNCKMGSRFALTELTLSGSIHLYISPSTKMESGWGAVSSAVKLPTDVSSLL